MRVLITGATGLVGEELTKLLLQNGIEINYLTTSKEKIESQPNFQGFYWNPSQGIIDEACLVGVCSIINLAGASIAKRWTKKYKQQIVESRTLALNLLYSTLKNHTHQITQIISASAIGVYPDDELRYYKEDFEDFKNTFLANVVLKWEDSANQFERLGLHVCKLRIGLVLSTHGGALPQMIAPYKMYLGSGFGSGKQWQSWIHIHDLVRLFLFALHHNLTGIYNAVAPNPITNNQLNAVISEALDKPILVPNVPAFVLKLLLGEMHTLLLESQHVSSEKIEEEGFEFEYKNIHKALENLLHKKTPN